MKEQLIEFETAVLAKEKGFGWVNDAKHWYNHHGIMINNSLNQAEIYPIVTQSLLQRWLREIHNLHITISFYENNFMMKDGYYYNTSQRLFEKYGGTIYEDALEKGLQEILKLIK